MVATTSQQTIGNIAISGSFVAFIFSTFLATVVFDKPSKCTDAYIPEIEMAMMVDPTEQHIEVWVDAFLPIHSIADVTNIKKIGKDGRMKAGGLIDLFPSNGPARGWGTVKFKIEVVDRKNLPPLNITRVVPMAYIKESTFTGFKRGYLKLTALYIKYFKYLVALTVLWGFVLMAAGGAWLYYDKTRGKKTPPVHATVEANGNIYDEARGGHSMIKTPIHEYPTPIRTFEIPKAYMTDTGGHLAVNSNMNAYQATPVHAFETPVHRNGGIPTPVVAFMETPNNDGMTPVDVIVESIPVDENATADPIPEEAEEKSADNTDVELTENNSEEIEMEVEAQVEETVTASVETLVHDLVDRLAPAMTDTAVRSSVKTMVHSMVEKLVHTLVDSLSVAASGPSESEPKPEATGPIVESPMETLDEALNDTPEVEKETDVQIIEVLPAAEDPQNEDELPPE